MLTDGGSSALKSGRRFFDAVGDRDGVGAGLALDGQDDGARAVLMRVEPGGGLIVFDAIDDLAELFKAHGRAIAIGDHDGPVHGRRRATGRWPGG